MATLRAPGAGVVEGDISHRTLAIEENARFEGTSRRSENAIDAQSFVQTKDDAARLSVSIR
jgi:cytoskeletal protein CcmA (bactofilin family)